MKTTSEDKSIDGGKTRMGIIYQNVIFWWKINHPPFPKFWPFWSNYNLGVVWDAFSMNSKTWRYRISDITYQILGLRIFELDVLLFSPLRFVFQNSLKKFKLGRKILPPYSGGSWPSVHLFVWDELFMEDRTDTIVEYLVAGSEEETAVNIPPE